MAKVLVEAGFPSAKPIKGGLEAWAEADYAVEVPLDLGLRLLLRFQFARRLPIANMRVLIVDDHAILRDGICALLALHDNIEVVGEAADGRDAIDKVRQCSPDVVLMDIVMPLMDGLEATRRILKENPEVRVLILTQHDSKEYILSCIKAGAAGFLTKRAVVSDLLSAMWALHRGDPYFPPSATSVLLKDYRQRREKDPHDGLTNREREALKLVAEGRTSREIGDLLCISVKTVLGHRAKIMEKLDIHNGTELVKYAIRKGLISADT